MFQLTANQNYCTLAVTMVEEQVAGAEAAIAGGGRPDVAGDSYLEVGPMIADLSLTLHVCGARVTPAQRTRWSAYAEQAIWNVWHQARTSDVEGKRGSVRVATGGLHIPKKNKKQK